jgi:predicted nucleic acid-binding protein
MPYFTYDTSVIVSRKNIGDLRKMPQHFLMSSVVLMELTAGAADASIRKAYEQVFHQYRRDKLLIVPNDDDWLLTAKIMFLLAQGRRRDGKEGSSGCRQERRSVWRWTF